MRTASLSAADVIRMLDLEPLPIEGGYFRVTFTGSLLLPASALPPNITSERPVSSVIYYLLTADSKSRLHRLEIDEMWHFYVGDLVELYVFGSDDNYTKTVLGSNLAAGQSVQTVVPAHTWFGARLGNRGSWALMACSLAPAYSDEDFSLPNDAEFADLVDRFPSQRQILHDLR